MIERIKNIFLIPELRARILFTLGILVVVRAGVHIPIPGVNGEALKAAMANYQNTLFGLFDLFAGGAFQKASLFALGIMPYISASIILQLMGSVVPYFQRLQKEGEEGRKKLTQLTRYATVGIGTLQAFSIAILLESMTANIGGNVVSVISNPGILFKFTTIISVVTGVILLMWLGERITERGIGNGISLIIMVGIISRLPSVVLTEITLIREGLRGLLGEVILLGLMFVIVAFVVLLTQGTRKIPVQYAKRVVGRKVYGGQSTHIPLRVNTAGVMPIIFAQAIMFIPSTIAAFFPNSDFMLGVMRWFGIDHPFYWIVFGAMIVFFTYFYTAMAFDPVQVSSTTIKQQGGFIPGVTAWKKNSRIYR